MKGLDGKVALVTGGGRDVGRSIALALAARGVRVVVTGRDERALGETVGEIAYGGGKARHLAGDVRDPAHLDAAVERAVSVFGGLDIVVANAGLSDLAAGSGGRERADAIFGTTLMGAYYAFHAAAPRMKGPGRLVATASALALPSMGDHAALAASKAGIVGLVGALAHELAPKQITCNAVLPGWVDTEASAAAIRALAASAPAGAAAAEPVAGRLLDPDEVAGLVLFLCSSAAGAITGQAIPIGVDATAFGG